MKIPLMLVFGVVLAFGAARSLNQTLAASPVAIPTIAGCQFFPPGSFYSVYNANISHAPVDPNSDKYIATYPTTLTANFGYLPGAGMPFNVVPASQPMVPITFTKYPDESDPGPYPIPPQPKIEGRSGGRDHHLIVLQKGTCTLYEMWQASYSPATGWIASGGAKFSLNTVGPPRPLGWTSADAAGTPILGGLIRCSEVRAGTIAHAINLVIPVLSQNKYVLPATHIRGSGPNPNYLPMGARLRLKASYDISGLTGQAHVIAVALQQYGAIVMDGGPRYLELEGTDDTNCWNEAELQELRTIPSAAFEVVIGPARRVAALSAARAKNY